VAADGDGETECFNSESAEDEGGPLSWRGKEHERGYREKESGWHDQQSGVLHGLSFSEIDSMSFCLPDPGWAFAGPQSVWFVAESCDCKTFMKF
jgi:hypothetical protein